MCAVRVCQHARTQYSDREHTKVRLKKKNKKQFKKLLSHHHHHHHLYSSCIRYSNERSALHFSSPQTNASEPKEKKNK